MLLDEARTVLLNRNGPYGEAIDDLRVLVATLPIEDSRRRTAHELLGYAFEKGKDNQKAKQEYARYLATYPEEGEDHTRVRQRLMAIEIQEVPHRLTVDKNRTPHVGHSVTFEGDVQEYVYGQFQSGVKTQFQSITGVQFGYTLENNQYLFTSKLRLTDIKDVSNSNGDRKNLSLAFIEGQDTFNGRSIRIGRQMPEAGAISRFDGVTFKQAIGDSTKVTVAAGVPYVGANSDTRRRFIGAQVDHDFTQSVAVGAYATREKADGILDRSAVGTQIAFRSSKSSSFITAEYDTLYKTLNSFTAQGTRYYDGFDIFGVVERRRSPMLYGDIALNLGMLDVNHVNYSSFSDIMNKSGLQGSTVYDYIKQSTPIATSFVVGAQKQLSKNWSLTGDIQETNISTVPGFIVSNNFDPVPIQVGTKKAYTLDLHLRGENFVLPHNTTELVVDGGTNQYFVTVADTLRFGLNQHNSISAIARYSKTDYNGFKVQGAQGILRGITQVGDRLVIEGQYSRSLQASPLFKLQMNQEVYVGVRYAF